MDHAVGVRQPNTRIAAWGVLVALCWPSAAAAERLAERVVVVSLDGVAAAELNHPDNELPMLRGFAKSGVHGAATSVLPSVTWAAHTTLVTGVLPARHGVVGNHWLDREAGVVIHAWQPTKEASVAVPTIYDVAHTAGLSTAALLWPQTSGAPTLDLSIPEVYSKAAFSRFVTPKLRRGLDKAGIAVDRLAELSEAEEAPLDELAAKITEHVIEHHGPHLLLVHLTSADTRAHRAGPGSPRHRAGLALYDRLVGRIVGAVGKAGHGDRTAFFVVSDHGFFATTHQVDAAGILARAGLKPPAVRVVANGHLAYVYVKGDGAQRAALVEQCAVALRAHPAVEQAFGEQEYARHGLPLPKDNPAVGDLVALTRTDHYFGTVAGDAVVGKARYRGTHGYLPDVPANHAVFIAWGAGIRLRAEPIRLANADVAPTIARLLGLTLPGPLDGRVRDEILATSKHP